MIKTAFGSFYVVWNIRLYMMAAIVVLFAGGNMSYALADKVCDMFRFLFLILRLPAFPASIVAVLNETNIKSDYDTRVMCKRCYKSHAGKALTRVCDNTGQLIPDLCMEPAFPNHRHNASKGYCMEPLCKPHLVGGKMVLRPDPEQLLIVPSMIHTHSFIIPSCD
jgi:hypothetical protein